MKWIIAVLLLALAMPLWSQAFHDDKPWFVFAGLTAYWQDLENTEEVTPAPLLAFTTFHHLNDHLWTRWDFSLQEGIEGQLYHKNSGLGITAGIGGDKLLEGQAEPYGGILLTTTMGDLSMVIQRVDNQSTKQILEYQGGIGINYFVSLGIGASSIWADWDSWEWESLDFQISPSFQITPNLSLGAGYYPSWQVHPGQWNHAAQVYTALQY